MTSRRPCQARWLQYQCVLDQSHVPRGEPHLSLGVSWPAAPPDPPRPRPAGVIVARLYDARVVVDSRPERGPRPEASTCCGDAVYPVRGARLRLHCLNCGQACHEANRGGWVRLQVVVQRFVAPDRG